MLIGFFLKYLTCFPLLTHHVLSQGCKTNHTLGNFLDLFRPPAFYSNLAMNKIYDEDPPKVVLFWS